MACNHLRDFYELYALGVLDGLERVEIEAHLAQRCPECVPAVEQARQLVANLAYLAPAAEPSAALKGKLMAQVSSTPRMAPTATQVAAEPPAAPPRQRVIEFDRPRRSAWSFGWGWATAVAAMALVLVGMQYLRLRNETGALRSELAELREQFNSLNSETATYRQAMAIAESDQTRALTLTSTAQSPKVRAFWHETLGMVIAANQMPLPAPDRTFQLWVVPKSGAPISAGIFRPDATGRVLLVSSPDSRIADAAAIAITDEPSAGSPGPTTTPIWVSPLGT
jgi:anti-sigma-K factor RskA